MKSQLLIPEKLRVGFQKREDTYTKKLAYVIYYGPDGKLRKETSWKGWCHIPGERVSKWNKNIVENDTEVDLTPFDVDNKPHSGFVLNKGVQRYGYWGGGRNMVRVYDDRGIEFEITIDNLMFILMTTNCHKRGLEGEFVYAWGGHQNKNLILLPVGCEEYQESLAFTGMQDKKITKADLVPGCAYTRKDMTQMIYLGQFKWYSTLSDKSRYRRYSGKSTLVHVFSYKKFDKYARYDEEKREYIGEYNTEYFTASKLDKVATKDTDVPVSNYPELLEEFSNHAYASAPVEIVAEDKEIQFLEEKRSYYSWSNSLNGKYYLEKDGKYLECIIYENRDGDRRENLRGYSFYHNNEISLNGLKLKIDYVRDYSKETKEKIYSKEELKALNFKQIFIKLESGKKVKYGEY